MSTVDWQPPRPSPPRTGLVLLGAIVVLMLAGGTLVSYYVESLWFDSLGFADVFWKTLRLRAMVWNGASAVTFAVLYGGFLAMKPAHLGELAAGAILINGQPVRVPIERVVKLVGLGGSLVLAVVTGLSVLGSWNVLALYAYGPSGGEASTELDPIFGRPLTFYFFALPALNVVATWAMTVTVVLCAAAAVFALLTAQPRRGVFPGNDQPEGLRAVSVCAGLLLLALAARVYLNRFGLLFDAHTIFSGVTYTDEHVTILGRSLTTAALVAGAVVAFVNAVARPKLLWLGFAVAPAVACYVGVGVVGWYVSSFLVKPNELVRERPYIAHNIALTQRAFGLDRIETKAFPADSSLAAIDAPNNQATLQNIRLWDWRALRETLQQIQEIRTYYDFPDIDIDRYPLNGQLRQVMLAARELDQNKLPESSRNWINQKLVYTHGYGVTMNPVNGFTDEGLPALVLKNMPVESSVPDVSVTRPEIYFGELTNTDVYVNTRQQEFNYPQGDQNSLTSYEGKGGIPLSGALRRLLIAVDQGDLTKLPFSDDIGPDSRLLMRRNVRDRVAALAPLLTFDPDPYLVIAEGGRLFWVLDAFTTSQTYPYARTYRLGNERLNYLRNSVKAVVDAYDGTTTFYVFDDTDPIVAAYRRVFPSLFSDSTAMPASLRTHVRYPQLLLELQAAVYTLYHMTEPDTFYNREDLWSVATEVVSNNSREQTPQTMEPNYVLMSLPGEKATEFVGILPFTPANRNNLIGWIAGRSDGAHYGTAIAYDFPKTRLVDGPLQIEARIDQDPQLSSQLSLWNQQGSNVRRGALIVIPVGQALLYAEPIYLQADRSPMPQLRIVVLAMQDKLAYGPTFEAAAASLFGDRPSSLTASVSPRPATGDASSRAAGAPAAVGAPSAPPASAGTSRDEDIAAAARDFTDYQRLTADGKLVEAGERLQSLKERLERLTRPAAK